MAWSPFDPYGSNLAYLEDELPPPWHPTAGMEGILGGAPVDPQQREFWESGQGAALPPLPGYQNTPEPPPGGYPQPPGSPPGEGNNIDDPNFDFFRSIYGLSPVPQIGEEILGENPQISQGFSGNVNEHWQGLQNNAQQQIGSAYNSGNWERMNAAQIPTNEFGIPWVPKTTAQTPESFDALQFLLSGKGYDDPTLARMNAEATDSISREAASQRGAAKIAAEQAGMTGSGADLAIGGQVNRRAGDARTRALNEIAIQDARQGAQNRQIGSGMELNRRTSEAGMANQTAIENAAREFAGMQANLAHQQQANRVNTGNTQQREMARAGAQAGTTQQGTADYSRALLTKAAEAESQNATNTINRNLNQANLNRGRQIYNTGIGEGRYSQALGSMVSLAGGAQPAAYNFNYQYNPNLIGANAFSNLANSFLNYKPQQAAA